MTSTPSLAPERFASLLLSALEEGSKAAVLVLIRHPKDAFLGRRLLVSEDASWGSLGDPGADSEGVGLARRALAGTEGLEAGTYRLPLQEGGEAHVFLELHHPTPELIIVGAGHVAQPLSTAGALLGLRVRVLDDRPRFATRERFPQAHELGSIDFQDPFRGIHLHPWSHVVLVTRGHKYDYECLRRLMTLPDRPGYIGMIGSRRRVRATFDALLREGVSRERLDAVHAPIGLDIGAETPAEIALSVAAEIVLHRRGGTGNRLKEMEGVLSRFGPPSSGDPSQPLEGNPLEEDRGEGDSSLHPRTGGDE